MELVVMPAVIAGLVIGLYEIILLHRDVTVPTHRFGHSIHAIVFAIIACFCTLNAQWVITNFAFLSSIPMMSVLTLQIIVGLVTAVKIHGVSAAIKGAGMGMSIGLKETWFHSILIGALVIAVPYVWPFAAPLLPSWMK